MGACQLGEIYKIVEIVEVTIGYHDYSVIVSVLWEEFEMAIVVLNVLDEEHRNGCFILVDEADPAEMKYDRNKYLLLTCKG